ncbi:MAG: tetratricopeptide repeat protein [Gammaproteobacteria bacterium]|nr:tetratricopeptide repeat protein [Gammaproteobacteria bacterium]
MINTVGKADVGRLMTRAFTLLVTGPMVIMLGACAVVSKPVMGEENTAAEETSTAKTVAVSESSDAPDVPLTEDILYDILVGEIAGQRGQLDTALESLGRAAQKTRDPRLAERATRAAVYAKRYEDALLYAQLWVGLRPKNQEAHESIAFTLMELQKPVQAALHFESMLALAADEKSQERAYRRVAAVLGRQQDRVAAVKVMRTLVDKDIDNAHAHFALAYLAVRTDDLDVAVGSATEALRLKPDWDEAALFKAGILVSQKDNVKAQAFYEKYLADHHDSVKVRLNYARYLVDIKQWEKARAQFLQVLKDSPEDADALYAVGLLSLQTHRLDDAAKYLEAALKLRPENQQTRIYLGQVAEERKDYVEAARWYSEVILGEHYFEAQTRLAVVVARQGDLEGARQRLHEIETQSDEQRVHLYLAEEQVLREAKRYKEALAVLDGALDAISADKDLLYARALIAEKLGLVEFTERDLRLVLQQEPENAQALNALGYTLADRTERYDEALELIQRALALKPDDPFILDSMGWVQYRLGNNGEAIKYLKQALSIRNDAEISAHLGEVLWIIGDRTQARTIWDEALENTPDNEILRGVIRKFNP